MIGGPEAGTSGEGGGEQEHAGNSTGVVKSCADTDKLLLTRKVTTHPLKSASSPQ